MNRRPAGVTFAAVVLGLGAALLVLSAALTVFAAVVGMSAPAARAASAPEVLMVVALIYFALAGWAAATVVGLFRMRAWARVSMLVIGSLVAVMGMFSTLMSLAMPGLLANMPMPPNANPAAVRALLLLLAFLCLLLFAVGLWWVIYFALRKTRKAFTIPLAMYPIATHPAPLPHAHTLDFYEAQPVAPAYVEPPPVCAAPAPVAVSRRPASMTTLAVLLFLGAVSALPAIFANHAQAFFLGFFVTGAAARVVFALIFFWALATGLGLLALRRAACYSAMAYCVYGMLTGVAMMLPYGRARMGAVFLARQGASSLGASTALFNPFAPPLFAMLMVPALCLAIGLNIFFLVLLYRARYAFGPDRASDDDPALR